ncbi:MAG: C10 family peptidase [Paludibacteraceae bacterium]|nr:C10 family peptidase [Paludibacteraceae bacterium]
MKHYLTIAFLCLSSAVAVASEITAGQAMEIAQSFLREVQQSGNPHFAPARSNARTQDITQDMQLAHTGTDAYYALNLTDGEGGFVIVAADDRCENQVLAYSPSGHFDLSTMPADVSWWIKQYEHIDYTNRQVGKRRMTEATTEEHAVEPMVETEWAQGDPYNLRTPVVSGSHCATGCVATAWAQLLYFHKYPAQATGKHGYYWNNQYLVTEFQTPYDWEHMLNKYGTSATGEERQAVALLMSDIGIASELSYGVSSTGGHEYNSLHSMVEHFGYDSAAEIRYRDVFDVVDWRDMLRRNLDKGLPLYYGGFSKEGGHAFVCDGYKGDMFHFNFGWGGGYNGYYVFNKLHGDYNDRQCAVFDFQPNKGGKQVHTLTLSSDVQLTRNREVRCGAIYTGLYDSISFQVGLFFEDISTPDSLPVLIRTYDNSTANVGLQQFGIMPYVLSKTNENGTYKAYYRYRGDSTDTWHDFYYPHGVKRHIVIEVADGKGTVVSEDSADTSIDFLQDGIYYTVSSEYFREVKVARHNYSKTEYLIPGTIVRNGTEYKVTSIADSAFLGCTRLQQLRLQEGIEHIGIGAFAQCTRLEQLILPSTLVSIENNAFAGDAKLTHIRSYATTPPELKGTTVFQRNRIKLMTLWVSCEASNNYKTVNIWNDMQIIASDYYLSIETEGEGEVNVSAAGCDTLQVVATAGDHYYFSQWGNGAAADTLIVVLEGDSNLLALFKAEIYAVRFYVESELLKTDSVAAYQSATAPEAPSIEGYRFAGWDKDFSSIVADTDVNAVYEAESGVEDIARAAISGKATVYTPDGRLLSTDSILKGNLAAGIYILHAETKVSKIIVK